MKSLKAISIICMILLSGPDYIYSYTLNFDRSGSKLVKKDNGAEIYNSSDGAVIKVFPDREEALLADKTRIIKFKTGRREIIAPDGVKIFVSEDSSTRYLYPDGREEIFSMDGKTHYGLEIKEERRFMRRRQAVVELVYSKDQSDEVLEGNYKKFFEEFAIQIQRFLDNKTPGRSNMKVVISNCRYAKTGFCNRNGSTQMKIFLYRDEKEQAMISISHEQLMRKHGIVRLAVDSVDTLFNQKK